jgi:hypothetical protein
VDTSTPGTGHDGGSLEPTPRPTRPRGRPRRQGLTVQQRRAVLILAITDNAALTGRMVGVNEATVRLWRRTVGEFRDELDRRRGELLIELEEDASAVRREVLERRRQLIRSKDDAVALRIVLWHLERFERIVDKLATSENSGLPEGLQARLDALDDAEEGDDA